MSSRLDAAVAARGLARSRTHATQLITAGLVTVDGVGIVKPSVKVDDGAVIVVAETDHYVSRGAHKLVAALDAFDIDVTGMIALDMGASTGGFTQVLRERGAHIVLAVDVGHDQLAPSIAADPAVRSIEGFNVRYMSSVSLAEASGVAEAPRIVTGDLSFISLHHVLPAVAGVAASDADIVLLIKPQFEVGRTGVREGLVTDPGKRADAVASVLWAAWDAGLGTFGLISSPIVGTHGNAEYLALLRQVGEEPRADAGNPTQWLNTVNELAGVR